jgi:effector-binding domain-containing protein
MVDMATPAPAGGPRVFEREPGVVEIQEARAHETAVVTIEVPMAEMPEVFGPAIGEVAAACGQAGVGLAGPPFARYLRWDPEPILVQIGFPVLRPAPAIGRVHPASLPGGTVASIIHEGPYDSLAATYGVLTQWLEASGRHALVGPMWEIYWTDPDAEPDPARWRTEIIQPIG